MMEIFKQYGMTVLYVITAFLVFGALALITHDGQKGFVNIIYNQANQNMETVDVSTFGDTGTVEASIKKRISSISPKNPADTMQYKKGLRHDELLDKFESKNASGDSFDISITEIYDSHGSSIASGSSVTSYIFTNNGTYIIEIADTNGMKGTFKIFINP